MIGVILFASALAAGFASAQPSRGETVKVYAAAAVKTPLTHIIADYEKTSGNKIAVVYDTAGATEVKRDLVAAGGSVPVEARSLVLLSRPAER